MLVQYSKIIDSPVVELDTQTKVGVVHEIVINNTKFSVAGIVLKKDSFLSFGEPNVVVSTDMVEMNSSALIVKNEEAVTPLSEAIRLKELIDHKYIGIYQRVVSKKGRNVGLVHDYLIDSATFRITKLYCRTLLSERIIPIHSVIKMEGKKIIIKDDFEKIKVGSPITESSLV
jgi:uncharacterized protein YrrD